MWSRALTAALLLTMFGAGMGSDAEANGVSAAKPAIAMTDASPLIRVRGVPRDAEFTPLQFGDWIRCDWPGGKGQRCAPGRSPTTRLNASSESFRLADADGNGRVTTTELADFLASGTRD